MWSPASFKVVLGLAAMPLALVACDSGGAEVDVTLREFAVSTSESLTDEGEVTFKVTNKGPE
jgi:hypothetical protein